VRSLTQTSPKFSTVCSRWYWDRTIDTCYPGRTQDKSRANLFPQAASSLSLSSRKSSHSVPVTDSGAYHRTSFQTNTQLLSTCVTMKESITRPAVTTRKVALFSTAISRGTIPATSVLALGTIEVHTNSMVRSARIVSQRGERWIQAE
jgi:hypothetical protein